MGINDYVELANRNGWDYSFDGERPYFMQNGQYAIPNENTTEEDKILLAQTIAEGSDEMVKLILKCWENGIKISGPCSGITEFHSKKPYALHFTFIGDSELISKIYEEILAVFPNFNHLYRNNPSNNQDRYDINYVLPENGLTKAESDLIFLTINNQLDMVLQNKAKRH